MSVIVNKTWPQAGVLECPNALCEAINDDPAISAVCEQVVVNNGTDIDITFDVAFTGSPDEDAALDALLAVFDCADWVDPDEDEGGLFVKNDGRLLVPNTESLNFEGAVAAVQFTDAEGGELDPDSPAHIPWQADVLIGTVEARNDTNQIIPNNTPVYIRGYDPATNQVLVGIADAGDPAKMPAIGLTQWGDLGPQNIGSPEVPDLSGSPLIATGSPLVYGSPEKPLPDPNGYVIVMGETRECNTSALSPNDPIYVAVGGGVTTTKPSGLGVETQIIARASYISPEGGRVFVINTGRVTDAGDRYDTISDGTTTVGATGGEELEFEAGAGISITASKLGSPERTKVNITNTSGAASTSLVNINGQLVLVFNDTTRLTGSPETPKQLSVTDNPVIYGENRLINNDWIRMSSANDTNSGFITELDGTVVYATGHCVSTGSNAKDIHLFVNGIDQGSIGTLSGGTDVSFINTTIDIDFSQGDKIRLRAVNNTGSPLPGTGPIEDTVVKLTFKWRG